MSTDSQSPIAVWIDELCDSIKRACHYSSALGKSSVLEQLQKSRVIFKKVEAEGQQVANLLAEVAFRQRNLVSLFRNSDLEILKLNQAISNSHSSIQAAGLHSKQLAHFSENSDSLVDDLIVAVQKRSLPSYQFSELMSMCDQIIERLSAVDGERCQLDVPRRGTESTQPALLTEIESLKQHFTKVQTECSVAIQAHADESSRICVLALDLGNAFTEIASATHSFSEQMMEANKSISLQASSAIKLDEVLIHIKASSILVQSLYDEASMANARLATSSRLLSQSLIGVG